MIKEGCLHGTVHKGGFIDGHERKDVVKYLGEFLLKVEGLSRRMVIFNEDGT